MTICLPLSVTIPRKTKEDKVFALNLNVYRNAHHMILSDAKNRWKGIVAKSLSDIKASMPPPPYNVIYTVFWANGRAFDIANVCSIIDKFTMDALQELGIIENDNYKHIPEVRYKFGGIDKENPRCELTIEGANNA